MVGRARSDYSSDMKEDAHEDTKHTTAPRASAGGVVLNSEGKMLLVRQHQNSWSFPKGGVEAGESDLEAARREIFEETGLRDIKLLLADALGSYERYSIGPDGIGEQLQWGLRRRTLFLFRAKEEKLLSGPELYTHTHGEVTDARWVSIDEALELLTHPKDREFLTSVRSRIEETR